MAQLDKRHMLFESKAFCMAPWVHLHVQTNGDVAACCMAKKPFGNINENRFSELWNGEAIKAFRQKMLQDQPDPRCWQCYDAEKTGNRSLRQAINEKYAGRFAWTETTEVGGFSAEAKPIYWDIRFSNICNFRCRTCWHGASSGWFEDAVQLGLQAGPSAIIRSVRDPDDLFAQLDDYIPILEEVYFAGGEPLIMEEHYRLLEMLERRGLADLRLRYNTNFSQMRYKDMDVMNLWRKFRNVEVCASLDGIGARGEYLRKGQSWPQVLANRERMKRVCPHIDFAVTCAVSVFNVLHIPDMHRELVESEFMQLDKFNLNIVQVPGYYSMKILPADLKKRVRRKFVRHLAWIESQRNTAGVDDESVSQVSQQFQNCMAYLEAEDWSERIHEFRWHCERLDNLRQEQSATIFPELARLFSKPAATVIFPILWTATWKMCGVKNALRLYRKVKKLWIQLSSGGLPKRTRYYNETENDRWIVEYVFPEKREGYFLEVGSANGRDASSCYVLEKELGWKGICVEPNDEFFEQLIRNRPNSKCKNLCVADQAGKVVYIEGSEDTISPYLGGIKSNLERFSTDGAEVIRKGKEVEKVAITLEQLLDQCNAPKVIDYAAFDIEGSELKVLEVFPFDKYTFLALSLECEDSVWPAILTLLESNGYVRVTNPFNRDKPGERYFLHETIA